MPRFRGGPTLVQHATRLVSLAAALLLPSRGAAQDVLGVLRAEFSGAPMEGVVLTAMRASDRAVVGRALSSSAGSFRLTVGTDSVVVMALRIGQRPVELWRGRVSAGESRDIGRMLPDVPVSIGTLRVQERARCGAPSIDESSVTRTLFADALTALSASIGSAQGEALVVGTVLTEEFRDLRGNVQRVSAPVARTGSSAQPFQSVPVPSLLSEGFVVTDRDGSVHYRAPDAHVLTADAFLARHCLSLDLSREAEGFVGIGFAPQRAPRNNVGVRGTLWLDAPTRELRTLEFEYVGLPPVAAAASPGGTVEYARLADGRWIIDRWSLRIPTLVTEVTTRPSGVVRASRTRASGLQVLRAAVLWVRLRGALLYTVGGADADRVLAGGREGDRPMASGAQDDTATCADLGPSTVVVSGVVRRRDGSIVPGALVEAEWRRRPDRATDRATAGESAYASATIAGDGRYRLCGVPRDERVTMRARSGEVRTVATQLRVPLGARIAELDLVLPGAGSRP